MDVVYVSIFEFDGNLPIHRIVVRPRNVPGINRREFYVHDTLLKNESPFAPCILLGMPKVRLGDSLCFEGATRAIKIKSRGHLSGTLGRLLRSQRVLTGRSLGQHCWKRNNLGELSLRC